MKFSHTIFYVPDVQATLDFFQKAFSLSPRFIHESGAYAELETGATALAFASEALAPTELQPLDPNRAPQAGEVVFTVPDVATAYQTALSAGAIDLAAPTLKPWGQTVAYVRAPSGILIELASPISA